jgi:HK97 gp10 family phage protein
MSIKLQLDGFDGLFEQIKKAGGTVDAAAQKCLKKSADIMQDALKSEMQKANVDGGLISRMPPPEVEANGNRQTARVGYKKGAYDENNPSDGYKVVFANYGTPHRSKHGKQPAKGFIERAKKKARPQIKKAQQETLNEIIKGLN